VRTPAPMLCFGPTRLQFSRLRVKLNPVTMCTQIIASTIEEACRDGGLLVRLLERLEGSSTLRGITPHPKTMAAALFNVRQVLTVVSRPGPAVVGDGHCRRCVSIISLHSNC
jgi:hypothetical protein